jgi:hypothetical protein
VIGPRVDPPQSPRDHLTVVVGEVGEPAESRDVTGSEDAGARFERRRSTAAVLPLAITTARRTMRCSLPTATVRNSVSFPSPRKSRAPVASIAAAGRLSSRLRAIHSTRWETLGKSTVHSTRGAARTRARSASVKVSLERSRVLEGTAAPAHRRRTAASGSRRRVLLSLVRLTTMPSCDRPSAPMSTRKSFDLRPDLRARVGVCPAPRSMVDSLCSLPTIGRRPAIGPKAYWVHGLEVAAEGGIHAGAVQHGLLAVEIDEFLEREVERR